MNNKVLSKLSYGIYVVSCKTDEKYTGCTINSIMQITSEPPIIALSVNHNAYTNECLKKSGKFAVSILSEKSNPLSIGTFGFRSGRDFDKFSVIPYEIINEMPVIKDSCGYLICEVTDKHETNSHTLFLAKITAGDTLNEEIPMTYSYYQNVIKGKSPKAAPTYIEEK